jgi:hypothetical protein
MSTDPHFLLHRKPKPGFPALQKAQQQLPRNSVSDTKKIACDLDGTLAQPRDLHGDIGNPLPGAVAFLKDCVDAGLQMYIVTGRPAAVVAHWLKRHAPGLESVVHICAIRPQVDVLLSAIAVRFNGTYPIVDELELP